MHVSIGWVDLFSDFCDPGYEHRENISSGSRAAAAGGFTDVLVVPNTNPVLSSKTEIEYLKQKSSGLPVSIHPIGSVTRDAKGKDLAEMYDMFNSGAVAFSDGNKAIQHSGVMLKALQYVQAIDSTIIQVPNDVSIAAHGLMHEGIISTRLGLPGKPAISEELMIARDIELLKYTKSKLHITGISTRKGIEMVASAKSEGLNISCSVTPYHLNFCDEDLEKYDTNLKVNPPLRRREDMLSLREAMNDGLIDCIASHHTPLHWDDKTCEFEYAKNGMIGLESLFGSVNSISTSLERLINQLTKAPRSIIGLPLPEIKEGSDACLTLFNPELSYSFDETMIHSKSKNSPFIGKELKGKVYGIINNHQTIISNR
ncbi:MAG: amidohydrolase family protein [Ferruginibacter sp.]|nr:amidohydrolase family protein [Ferruginibacter sp.]